MTAAWKRLDLERLKWPVIGLLTTLGAAAALNATDAVSPANALIVLLGVVLVVAWRGGFSTGIAATGASIVVTAYAMPPIHSLRIESMRDGVYLGLAAVQGLLISQLCGRLRKHRVAQRRLVEELTALHRRTDSEQRRMHEMEDDLDRLREAIPQRIGPALDALHQTRASLPADSAEAAKIGRAEDQIAAFAKALEDYARFHAPFDGVAARSAEAAGVAVGIVENEFHERGVKVELPEELPKVRIREADLQRVLVELLSNAIRFGGDPPKVRVGCQRQGGCWVFSIADNGPGMIPLRVARAFQLFGGENGHMGVGLAISRRIIRSYGGEMWMESHQGRGSIVYFTISAA